MTDTVQQTFSFPFDRLKFDRLFMESKALTFFNVRGSALIETVLFLSVVVLYNYFAGDGTRYLGATLHPFWIIVLLVTAQYGLKEALAAAFLSSIFLLAGNLPEQTMSQSTYEYILQMFSNPLMWMAAALVLGGIHERQISEKEGLIDGLKKFEEAMSVIMGGYKTLKDSKEQLEMRLAEERCSLLAVYNIASSLETFDSSCAKANVEKLIRMTLNPKKFSIYTLKNGALRLDSSYGWDEKDDYAKRFESGHSVTRAIIDKKRSLSVASEKDETVLNDQGLLAGPIINERTGKIFGMLKIEDTDFKNIGIRSEESFRIVCAWIAHVLTNIEKYQALSGRTDNGKIGKESAKLSRAALYESSCASGAMAQSAV